MGSSFSPNPNPNPSPPSLGLLEHTLQELRARGWKAEDVAWHAELLRAGPLSKRAPLGLRYSLVDSVLAALRGELGDEAGEAPLMPLLEPFFAVLGAAANDKEAPAAAPPCAPRPRRSPRPFFHILKMLNIFFGCLPKPCNLKNLQDHASLLNF